MKRFLWRIDSHPNLGDCEIFQNFLKAPIVGMLKIPYSSESSITFYSKESLSTTSSPTATTSSAYLKPVLDSLGDVLAATFIRSPKQVADKFLKMKKEIKMVKNHLSHLERLYNIRVTGHQPAIIEGMKEIAGNFDELSASIDLSINHQQQQVDCNEKNAQLNSENLISPSFVKSMLSRVSATMTQCAHLLDKSIDDQELNLLSVLLEYSQYCDSALELIETRDRKQVEVEELNKLVEGYENEIEELEGVYKSKDKVMMTEEEEEEDKEKDTVTTANSGSDTKDDIKTKSSTAGSSSFMNYLNSKWDSWKGVDPITARKNRLDKTQIRLKETKSALKTSQNLSSLLNSALPQEIVVFFHTLKEELSREFLNHSISQVNYHETNLVYWKDFLAWLDNPPKHL